MLDKSFTLVRKSSRSAPLVLIVDDNQDNLLFMSCILDALKLKYLIATNGRNALDLAMDNLPDLILLDIVMPEIDGMEITRLLKRNPLTSHIPVIAVTGLTLPQDQAAIKSAGCEDYLCKPFLINDFEAKLAGFVDLSLA